MALLSTEVRAGARGLVIDRDTRALVTTTDTTNAQWSNGFLRDPDGRLVVVNG